METKSLKVIIAADNALVVNGLRHNLENKFGHELVISGCYDVRILLRKVHEHADVVVTDSVFDGLAADELRKKISAIDHDTAVILHSSHQDVIAELSGVLTGIKEHSRKKFSHKLAS